MPDNFAKEKSDFLNKKDKSRKGSIDKDIVDLVNLINSNKDFYTTSSCAGRIVLLEVKSKRKDECDWIFTKHDKVKFKEVFSSLAQYDKKISSPRASSGSKAMEETRFKSSFKHPIWFKQQPIILHVACRSLDAAKSLLNMARKVFKHSGILSITERKTTIEIIGNERIDTIIADKNFAADENYIKQLLKYANRNFAENKRKSKKLLKIIKAF
ncbi:hypothetical protein HYX08_02250 [Candidatus Woesearchaeota archaeon]|nr:hypothetical protein [Candidatus Woesearchaeota archaeon]